MSQSRNNFEMTVWSLYSCVRMQDIICVEVIAAILHFKITIQASTAPSFLEYSYAVSINGIISIGYCR